ncbi:MAG: hypothetical protein U9Q33_09020 [Campylobacterota bacterium]|nr:hypothetical protein [Campylobacterota bacterium]
MKKCEKLKQQFISDSRLTQYKNIDEYFQNLKLCKQYYIPLSIIEIALRNSLNKFFSYKVDFDWLRSDSFIQDRSKKKIETAIKVLISENKNIHQDNILAELSFGFFVVFFKQPYQQYLRYNDLKQIFPNLPSSKEKKINRHFVFTKLNNIRLFRNKVFHHDKIISKKEYQNMMDEIYEVLSYFDQKIVNITKDLNK